MSRIGGDWLRDAQGMHDWEDQESIEDSTSAETWKGHCTLLRGVDIILLLVMPILRFESVGTKVHLEVQLR